LTIARIIQATNGRLQSGVSSLEIKSVSINTRTLKKGALYVAIKGANHDGHTFIKQAIENGAVAVLVSKKVNVKGISVILVKDTVKALGQIANFYRRQFKIPVVAITGSAGKTTTKNIVSSVLSAKYKVLKNERSENNFIGVPLTLFKLKKSHSIAVLEVGTNQKGDIAWLTKITEPDVAIFTNIGESHLEGLKNKTGIFNEKINLAKGLNKNGTIIYNSDDEYLKKIKDLKLTSQKISYSIINKSKFQAKSISVDKNNKTQFKVQNKKYTIVNPGQHHIYNALIAIMCANYFKVDYKDVQKKISKFKPDSNRGLLKKYGSVRIYNDTYNSNPLSFKSALDVISHLNVKGRKIVISGDMRELGRSSKMLHQRIAHDIYAANIDLLLSLGRESQLTVETFKKITNSVPAFHFNARDELHKKIKQFCHAGDTILVKGSRSMNMELTVDYLKKIHLS
ncbi:MAG: UDP-N-acetylmuramoyl-tripeptide--D-alanyl-D-alanine ligase, partial [Candidatus Omnitrophica bacterium]|nr:UDP-N-acetylmuramoyl-tripeptide--D-alanyl-D-alanine ligase [Candidatus Omnitrophota bacterium]